MSGVFDAYGRYYDLLYRDKDYAGEADWVLSRLRAQHPAPQRLLELGCGTGAHAEVFARRGLTVDGVDRSAAMLAAAAARTAALPPGQRALLRFAPGDVRTVRRGERYDAVLALFHVASYQTANADLLAFLDTAASHLDPGGLLAFDFWFGPAVLTLQPSVRILRLADADCRITRIAEPGRRPLENVIDVDYTLFVEDAASGQITRLQERHSMRYLFAPELAALAAPYFDVVEWRAWRSDAPPDHDSWSAFTVMRRKG